MGISEEYPPLNYEGGQLLCGGPKIKKKISNTNIVNRTVIC